MKFFLKDENHNAFEYNVPSAEKAKVLYNLVGPNLGEFYASGFYIYSSDLEVKINVEYPMYKYFGTCENISVDLEVKAIQKIEVPDDEMSQCESIDGESESESYSDGESEDLELEEPHREIQLRIANIASFYEKKIQVLHLIIVMLAFALIFK